jgi:hypothetical protein
VAERMKISLLAEGVDITPEARKALSAAHPERPLTLAEYATTSGIIACLDEDIWVNAPIHDYNPNFVRAPANLLDFDGKVFVVRSGQDEVRAVPIPVPDYHNMRNRWGEQYSSYGVTHTDRVRISPVEGCAIVCQFCDLPYEFRYRRKRIEGLLDLVDVALHDPALPARHVLISGGTPQANDYAFENEVYERVCRSYPGIEVDVMMVPMLGLLDLDRLLAAGVRGLYINMELYNDEAARLIMPAKHKLGREHVLGFIAKAVERFGLGRVSSLLVAGLEPLEDTLRGVQALAERGCQPVLSPFRPDTATPLRRHAPPSADELRKVYCRSVEIAERHGLKLGPRCVPCQHNTLTFPDNSGYYAYHS